MSRPEQQSELARIYAAALLDVADEPHADAVADELKMLAGLLSADADLREFVESTAEQAKTRTASLVRLLSDRVGEPTLGLVRVLADRGRLDLLGDLAGQFQAERAERTQGLHVEVTTAVALNESQRALLRDRLGKQFGAEVVLAERVDPEVIGGLILRVQDDLFDGSVRGRLEQLRGQVIARGSHEIQSGRDLVAD